MFHISAYMIPIQLIVVLCLGLLAVTMMAAKKTKAAKAKAKRTASKTGLEAIGVHSTHLKAGKAMVAGCFMLAAIEGTYTWDGIKYSATDVMMGKGVFATKTDVERRQHAKDIYMWNLFGIDPGTIHVANYDTATQGRSGKVGLGGVIIHASGKLKIVKKLTAGLPIRP